MENTLKLVGRSSNEIFTLRYPSTLVDFCEFDFSFFAQEAIEVCNAALKTGTPDFDKISEIKKDIQSAHCYMQYSTRTTYDKIVFDCWIDYVCRRDNIGNSALWNRFIRSKTPFEKIIFQRLCDFRYKRAVNEWLNVIRIQDYAKSKVRFVFPEGIKSVQTAEERKNYFDLMFSVTARELGCRLDDMGVTKYYSIGRTPGAPFMYPGISKEIVRHVLAGFDYTDDYSDITDYSESADEIAMDAFSRMKAGLPQDLSSYTIPTGKLENLNDRIYMPCGLKAAVDLEIDAMLENGMWLARCKSCGRYFGVTQDDYKEYCTRRNMPSGKTCIEIYEEQNPRPKMTDKLLERCDSVTDEVYARVGNTMSVEEFNSWRTYLEAMKEKVENGEILPAELESFLDYSIDVDITKSKPIVEVPKREVEAPKERVVRPFVPERISRSEIQKFEPVNEPEEIDLPMPKPSREGFFTSPSVQRQKNERPQISHIIRNGEPLGDNSGLSANSAPVGFQPFEAQYQTNTSAVAEQPARVLGQSGKTIEKYPQPEQFEKFEQFAQFERFEQPKTEREQAYDNLRRLEERLEQERKRREGRTERNEHEERNEQNSFKPLVEQENNKFVEDYPRVATPSVRDSKVAGNSSVDFQQYGGERYSDYERITPKPDANSRIIRDYTPSDIEQAGDKLNVPDNQSSMDYAGQERRYQPVDGGYNVPPEESQRQPQQSAAEQTKPEAEPKPRVIKKNAAAISAYGKMSGQSVTTVNSLDRTPSPAQQGNGGYEQGSAMPTYSAVAQQESYNGVARYSVPNEVDERTQQNNYAYDVNQQNTLDEDMLEPFKDIETIFDVLEQSGSGSVNRNTRSSYADYDYREERRQPIAQHYEEPDMSDFADLMGSAEAAVPEQPKRAVPTRPLRNDEAPAGFWTEDRGLFRNEQTPPVQQTPIGDAEAIADEVAEQEEKSELEMIREKRHSRSSKTQRLYDVIMREPDDNPNFRKKK